MLYKATEPGTSDPEIKIDPTTLPDEPPTKKDKRKSQEQKDKLRARTRTVKKVAQYYGISFNEAQIKYGTLGEDEIKEIAEKVRNGEISPDAMSAICPQCGKEMLVRDGRNGKFYGCVAYPKCTGTRPIKENRLPTMENIKGAADRMQKAMAFISEMGGTEEAKRYLFLAINALGG